MPKFTASLLRLRTALQSLFRSEPARWDTHLDELEQRLDSLDQALRDSILQPTLGKPCGTLFTNFVPVGPANLGLAIYASPAQAWQHCADPAGLCWLLERPEAPAFELDEVICALARSATMYLSDPAASLLLQDCLHCREGYLSGDVSLTAREWARKQAAAAMEQVGADHGWSAYWALSAATSDSLSEVLWATQQAAPNEAGRADVRQQQCAALRRLIGTPTFS
jgi:hypothetical protein